MKEKKQQPTTSKKSSHNTLDWVEKQLRDVVAFDMGLSLKEIESRCLLVFFDSNKANHHTLLTLLIQVSNDTLVPKRITMTSWSSQDI